MSGESPLLVVSTHGRREKRALWGLSLSLSLFLDLFILFIYFWLCWVLVAARGLPLVAASGGYSSLQCVGFSLQWLLLSDRKSVV